MIGRCQGLMTYVSFGGQMPPNTSVRMYCTASVGKVAELKKAQNQATKNITSEKMKSAMPQRRPFCTVVVCRPGVCASLITSRHQTNIVASTEASPI